MMNAMSDLKTVAFSALIIAAVALRECSCDDALHQAWTKAGYQLQVYASGVPWARGLVVTGDGDLLVVARGNNNQARGELVPSQILVLWDDDDDGISDGRAVVVAKAPAGQFTHGLALRQGKLYVSSDSTVWSYDFRRGQRSPSDASSMRVVVRNINADGKGGAPMGHWTRTLIFSPDERYLFVSVGSLGNVDSDSFRSRIRRFDFSGPIPDGGFDFVEDGQVYADGLRNEVGLAWDGSGVLWGVENGADNLKRDDLGGDIHNENPAEELNRFGPADPLTGKHYGYPFCWSEYSLPQGTGRGRGTAWMWPDARFEQSHDDQWCNQVAQPCSVAMQAHSAPLGITFYDYNASAKSASCDAVPGFPVGVHGHAFVGFHGSWNRDIPTGYKVVTLPFDDDGNPTGDVLDLLRHDGETAKWPSGVRPVDVVFDRCGRLLVSDDGSHRIFSMAYGMNVSNTHPLSQSTPCDGCGSTSSLSSGAVVGVVLGCVAFLVFIAFAATGSWGQRRRTRQSGIDRAQPSTELSPS